MEESMMKINLNFKFNNIRRTYIQVDMMETTNDKRKPRKIVINVDE
jgi:hypothetical protein